MCALAGGIGAVGITDESYVSLHGDMPRLLMNGVFILDLIRDRPLGGLDTLLEYAQLYYARYPALSIGHHAPLIAVLEAPAYALLGVSVFAARTVILAAFVAAAALLYKLVEEVHDTGTALLAAALFATSPFVVILAHSVLSEMLALALLLAAACLLHRYLLVPRRRTILAFAAACFLALSAKQLAVFAFPAFALALVGRLGPRALARREVWIAAAAFAACLLPLALMTMRLSPNNVAATLQHLGGGRDVTGLVGEAVSAQFAWPAIVLLMGGAIRAVVAAVRSGDHRGVFWLASATCALAGMVVVAPFEAARYGIYAVPALSALAALALTGGPRRAAPAAVVIGLLAVAVQGRAAIARPPVPGAAGYEEAARFVLATDPGPTVLFSGDVDTGLFSFFIRKHDAARRLVVLRSDKLLTTSYLGSPSFADRVRGPEEIVPVLRTFGTRYVVIEDRPSQSQVLEWLRETLRSRRFAERRRLPIGTVDPRLRGTSLAVYEFLDAAPPQPGAVLSIDLPIVQRSLSVSLADLIDRKYLR